jgi:hypothetical protein
MPIIQIILIIILVGVLLWLANRFLPMDEKVKAILNGFVVILLVLWLLILTLGWTGLGNIRIGPPHV